MKRSKNYYFALSCFSEGIMQFKKALLECLCRQALYSWAGNDLQNICMKFLIFLLNMCGSHSFKEGMKYD
jgi:hypothetical protein